MSESKDTDKYLEWAIKTQLRPLFETKYFLYHFLFEQYAKQDGIFSLEKNDKKLFNYLQESQIYVNEVDKVIEKLLVEHYELEGIANNILIILDYLKWSYGIDVDIETIDLNKYKREPQEHKENYFVPIKSLGTLRKILIEKYKCCQICGITQEKLLVQSHLKPQSISKKEEKKEEIYDINNVLLLCNRHDKLIDKGLITFTDEGDIKISKELDEEDVKTLGISDDIKVDLNEEQKKYMRYHREKVFKK